MPFKKFMVKNPVYIITICLKINPVTKSLIHELNVKINFRFVKSRSGVAVMIYHVGHHKFYQNLSKQKSKSKYFVSQSFQTKPNPSFQINQKRKEYFNNKIIKISRSNGIELSIQYLFDQIITIILYNESLKNCV